MAADNRHGLTRKQEAFACAYVETGNASEAYRRAGYDVKGMKPATLEREAHAVRHHPKVSPRIDDLMAGHAQRHDIGGQHHGDAQGG
jgi:phage terminase small subunit